VWVPVTVNGPPTGLETVPAELELSPQLVVAMYWLAGAEASGSVNVATDAVNDAPSVAMTGVPVAFACPKNTTSDAPSMNGLAFMFAHGSWPPVSPVG
jgi:hypothetical protein